MTSHSYHSEQEAAQGLLGEAVLIFSSTKVKYAVIGGWIPFLFYSDVYRHPGSFDVDILVDENTKKGDMDRAVDQFIQAGFLFAAKNRFQLHRILEVNGVSTVFHVDLLHRKYAPDQDEDFQLDWHRTVSMAGPGADVIFLCNEWERKRVQCVLPNGEEALVEILFASEIGVLSTKGRALHNPRRRRDSYDIFLIICQSKDYRALLQRSCDYYHSLPYFRKSIDGIFDFFTKGADGRNGINNVKFFLEQNRSSVKYMPDDLDSFISSKVLGFIRKVRSSAN